MIKAPRWYWLGLGGVILVCVVMTAWGQGEGLGNPYYSATSLSGSKSLSAMFYGSIDSGGFITVDKPPLATAIDSVSIRIFGLNSWSVLGPQILMGAATAVVLAGSVRRVWGPVAGLIGGLVFALTPATVAMNRQNLPDTVLMLCLVGAAYLVIRGLPTGNTWWMVGAMALVGLGFDAKLLQAWMVLPALGLAWFCFAATPWWRRALDGLISIGVVGVTSLAWPLFVDSRSPGARPHIGGSSDDTVMDLVFGYNGFGRVFGGEGNPQSGMFDSGPALGRMLDTENADLFSWLMPFAIAGLIGLVVVATRGRNKVALGAATLWSLWLVVHIVVFSKAEGIYHPYYTYAIVPAVAALVGGGCVVLWRERAHWWATGLSAVGVVGSALWAAALAGRFSYWNPWLGPATIVLGLVATIGIVALPFVESRRAATDAAATDAAVTEAAETDDDAADESTTATNSTGVSIGGMVLVATVLALVFAPAIYSTNSLSALEIGDSLPIADAGPEPPTMNPMVTAIVPLAQTNEGLEQFLSDQWDGERWAGAVHGSFTGSPMILRTGLPLMVSGGFIGFDPYPAADEFESAIESGELRYVLITDNAKVLAVRQEMGLPIPLPPGAPAPADQDGYFELPPPPEGFIKAAQLGSKRNAYVIDNCELVDPVVYGGEQLASQLWDCAAAQR